MFSRGSLASALFAGLACAHPPPADDLPKLPERYDPPGTYRTAFGLTVVVDDSNPAMVILTWPPEVEAPSARRAGVVREEEPPRRLVTDEDFAAWQTTRGEASVFVSTFLDPPGSTEKLGYWLAVPGANGVNAALYTGLTQLEPWILETPPRPLRDGAKVFVRAQLVGSARDRARDDPYGDATAPDGVLLLMFDLRHLAMDRDSDGLTDLEEERLLTRADSPDTDGDGRNDAVDVNPRVALDSVPRSRRERLRDEIVTSLLGSKRQLVLLASEPFDLPHGPPWLLTLSPTEATNYHLRYGYAAMHAIDLYGCGSAACQVPCYQAPSLPPMRDSDSYGLVVLHDPTGTRCHRWSEHAGGFRLEPAGGITPAELPRQAR